MTEEERLDREIARLEARNVLLGRLTKVILVMAFLVYLAGLPPQNMMVIWAVQTRERQELWAECRRVESAEWCQRLFSRQRIPLWWIDAS